MNAFPVDGDLLQGWLVSMERRRRVWIVMSAAAWSITGCSIAVSVLVAVDRWFSLPVTVREVVASLATASFLGFVTVTMIAAFRKVDPVASASEIEKCFPMLEERLVTLASGPIEIDSDIRRRLQSEVTAVLIDHPHTGAWDFRRSIAAAFIAITLVAALLVVGRRPAWAASEKRIFEPWVSVPAASTARLLLTASATVLEPRDAAVTLEARVQGSNADETVVLHVTDSTGETSIVMTPQGQNRFTRTLSRLLQSVEIYATTLELQSRTVHLSIGVRPTILSRNKP